MALYSLCQQISPWSIKGILFDGITPSSPDECTPHHPTFTSLQRSGLDCELCALICKALLDNRFSPGRLLEESAPILLASRRSSYTDSTISGPQVNRIIIQCGSRFTDLRALAEEESPAAKSFAVSGRFSIDPRSHESFSMVSRWLEKCLKTHTHGCRIAGIGLLPENILEPESVNFPTRILDVGESDALEIKLIDSGSMKGQYVTLSHRWPVNPAMHFTTTSTTIEERRKGIPLTNMPKTFQDAVTVVRKLELRYLWIDSLCILQDSTEDWERESAVMGQIYHQSTLTIMAATESRLKHMSTTSSGSKSQAEGFLDRADTPKCPTVKLPYRTQSGQIQGDWFLQYQEPLISHRWDLFTRGWVLQEEYLSRRKVMYHSDHVLWQCIHSIPESDRDVVYSYERFQQSKSWTDFYFSDQWLGTAQIYSERSLTFEEDKLPALSGLARYLADRHGQQYYAGIFSGSVAEGLLWAPQTELTRPTKAKYIAPSWSWLAGNGRIKMKAPSKSDELGDEDDMTASRSMLGNVLFKLEPKGKDPYGRLKGGQMILIGHLKRARMCRKEDSELLMQLDAGGKSMGGFCLDYKDLAPRSLEYQEVECLAVLRGNENVLVLRKVRDEMVFERVGIAAIDPEWFINGGSRLELITVI
ncbi:hypothetical protein EG329_008785 [Mollisiaceae sp. DMI_Dod_QoI]|nr:hypothetical protein EG329_008785 [Helotiales sp. DMI_Dod_QoI]